MKAKMVLLTSGSAVSASPKTAVNVLRYCPEKVVAVVDSVLRGRTCQEAFGTGGAIPVVGSLDEVADANAVVVGVAPAGGRLPAELKEHVLKGIARKMRVIAGLHQFLCDDPEIAEAARKEGVQVQDLRKNAERDVAHRQGLRAGCLRIHTVGHDCNVGKMVVSLELARALCQAGHRAKFVATGQTGILLEGDGCPIDAVIADFINGAAEKLVLANQHQDILLIEGQGSLVHPRYSAVTLGLLHGSVPDGLILCYEMGRQTVAGMDQVKLPPLSTLIRVYETMANLMHPCQVIGLAINSRLFSESEAASERERVRQELGLPVCDVVRHGPEELLQAILNLKTRLGK